MSGEAGKGSSYRPVNLKRYRENWDKIFAPNLFKAAEDCVTFCEECHYLLGSNPYCGTCINANS